MKSRNSFGGKIRANLAGVSALAAALILAVGSTPVHAAPFTPGNIVVYRVGDGTVNLINTGNPVFLDEYTSAGALVQSIAMPTNSTGTGSASNALVASGTATSEGLISRSADGRYILLTGYKSNIPAASSLPGSASATTPRIVGRVDGLGNIDTTTALTDFVTGNNPRSATSSDGNALWVAGAAVSPRYTTLGASTSTQISTTVANERQINIFNGQLYISDSSGSTIRLGAVGAGLPTTAGQTIVNLAGLPTSTGDPYGFYFADLTNSVAGLDTLYVADSTAGTIIKYCLVSGTWTSMGTISAPTIFGLTATVSGTTVTLFGATGSSAATGGGSIYTATDTAGYGAAPSVAAVTTIATLASGSKEAFRGITLAPISAPIVTASAATSITATTASLNGNVTSDGGSAVTERGFVYKTTAGATINDNKTSVAGTTGAYNLGLSSLGVNTQYFFKAYAINFAGTNLSSPELNFWTLANVPTAPVVGGATSSSLDVAIDLGDGNPATTLYSILETNLNEFVQADGSLGVTAVFQTATAWGTKTVTGLASATTYAFEATAQNGAGVSTAAGSATSGMTTSAATPTITIIPNSLSFGQVAVNGTSTAQPYTISGTNLTANITITAPPNFEVSTNGTSFGSAATLAQSAGVVADTIIYVHFKPTAQIAYSDNVTNISGSANNPNVSVTGTGANPPSVSTQTASAVTTNSATLNGTVVAANNSTITDRGFYWKTSPGVTTSDTQLSEGGTAVGSFSKSLGSLSANTIYYYRAYAVNAIGVTLDSADVSFYTLANTPVAPVLSGATQHSLNVAISAGDGNPAATTYAILEIASGNYVQADGSLAATAVYQTAATWNPVTVTGLGFGTSYSFKVKARSLSDNSDTAFGPAATASTANAPFTARNLAVNRVGNGTETLNANGDSIFIDEFTAAGTRVQSFPLPDNGVNAFIGSGSSGSEGALMRAADGSVLALAGYNVAYPFGSSVSSATASAAPRAIGALDATGNFAIVATTTTLYGGNNFRGAATDGGSNYWGAGAVSGTEYLGAGTPGAVQTAIANTRVINIVNGNLYFTTASTSAGVAGIWGFAGAPTGGGTATQLIFTGTNSSPYGFAINPAATIAYVADDGSQTSEPAGDKGIQRWDNVGGTWSLTYTLGTGAPGFYARGIAVDFSGTDPVIYATTTESSANRLITITDTNSSAVATTLATSATATFFRGVAFTPITIAAYAVGGGGVTCSGSSATVTLSGSQTGLSYQLFGNSGLTPVGAPITGTGSSLTWNSGITAADTYTVVASDGLGAQKAMSGSATVTVSSATATNVSYLLPAGTPFQLAVSNLLANASGTGGVTLLSVSATSANGVPLTISSNAVIYSLNLTNNDSFNYTVSSVLGGCTASGLVSIISTNLGSNTISVSGGAATINVFGIPNFTYVLQTATNIMGPWLSIQTNTAAMDGTLIFVDPNGLDPQRYYRTTQP